MISAGVVDEISSRPVRREHKFAIADCQHQIDSGNLSASYSLVEHSRALSDLDRHELEGARVRSLLLWTE